MKALILAAGFGTRLKPFTNHSPKAMVPVNQIPLILYIIAWLKKNGIKDLVINLHHKGQKIQRLLKNGSQLGCRITYSHEADILGTGGGIQKALRYLSDDFLIINGDIVVDFDLKAMLKEHKKHKPLATLALYKHKQAKKYGCLYYKGHKLISILSKPKGSVSSAMFSGIHILAKEQIHHYFKKHPHKPPFCIMRHAYMPLLSQECDFNAHILKGFWQVCDSLEDVKNTEKNLAKHKLSYHRELQKIIRSPNILKYKI
jgi:NDP-sugar pyrophosphorylase family protein